VLASIRKVLNRTGKKGLLIFVCEPMIPKRHGSKALPFSASARAQTSKTPTIKTNTDEVYDLGT